MAKAESLFKRHWQHFCKETGICKESDLAVKAVLYAACIIAESIRTEMDEAEFKDPKEGS